MNKETILKEYKNYCSDLNIDYKKRNNKSKFIYDYLIYLHNIGKLSYCDNSFNEIENYLNEILQECK